MNASPDDPSEIDVPLTRADLPLELDDAIERTEVDPDRTSNSDQPIRTLEVTDPAMTRAPDQDLTAGGLSAWMNSGSGASSGPNSEVSTGGTARRGTIDLIEPGLTLYAKYHVLKKLGGGAMGDVWLVRHATLKSEHALKVIVPNFARSAVALMRFQREFEVMATLRHEHAVTIYDACIDDDGGYIDMEFVDGLTLDTILATARARPDRDPSEPLMPLDWIVRVLDQLCEVLQVAHEKGIVHRDLKPSNMMLVSGRKPGKEYLKVLDFGIAKIRDDPEGASGYEQEESSHKTEGFIGTPSYGSPEQALAMDDIDGRADLYSVGIMLYEFVVGRLPFRGSPLQVMSQNASAPPPPFHEANPKLRSIPEVEYTIGKILSKDRNHRPQTARELFDEFREAVEAVLPAGSPELLTPQTSDSFPYYDPAVGNQTTHLDNSADGRAMLSTMEATQVGGKTRGGAEPVKASGVESLSDLGAVVSARSRRPWRLIVATVTPIVLMGIIGAVLVNNNRTTNPVVGSSSPGPINPEPSNKTPRFEDYWPDHFVPVDTSGKTEVWPDKVRRTPDDRYFVRFADGIYLPEGYKAEDPSKLVDGWPAAIVRDGIRFVRIKGGEEWPMGAWDADVTADRSDVPAHAVKLTGYYLQETEVTNGQYLAYLQRNQATEPAEWLRIYRELKSKVGETVANKHPAVNLSRKQAIAFGRSIDALLPTEAQWEFAARSRGKRRRYAWGDAAPSRSNANIDSQNEMTTAPVESYPEDRTEQGIYDMVGNVQEFCRDVWERYRSNPVVDLDPCVVPSPGDSKLPEYVIRGACFNSIPEDCAVTRRDEHRPETEFSEKFGFRLVVECPVPRKAP